MRKTLNLGILFLLLSSVQVFAQRFEISPAKMYFELEPGQSETQQIVIRNLANQKQTFVVSLGDWTINEEGDTEYYEAGQLDRSCAEWVTISNSFFTLQPNETYRINVTMLIPEGKLKTKWSMIYVRATNEKTSTIEADKTLKMGINISSRIGVQVYQSPASNTDYAGTIEYLREVESPVAGRRLFNVDILNTGDKLLDCKVYLMISNLDTGEEKTLEPYEYVLLPEISRTIDIMLPENLSPGNYSIATILDYGVEDDLQGVQMDIEITE